MGLWLPTEEEMEERRKQTVSVVFWLDGYCNRPIMGRCDVKAYMKSLGYDGIKIVNEGQRFPKVKKKGYHVSYAYEGFNAGHAVVIVNKEQAQKFESLSGKKYHELCAETEARCAKCKYHKSR